jgi:glyoxylase-like metal-dependent hydrolase (beta-lactamase superfamily II)
MNKVKVIVEGYAKENNGGWLATCNTTLIKTNGHSVLVDPGINKTLLLQSLSKEHLSTRDIDYIFLTHYHPDHILLAALFENAIVFDGDTIYDKDKESPYADVIPDTDIRVIKTPGHAYEHSSLIVNTNNKGVVVVAGDAVWWMDGETQNTNKQALLEKEDPYVKDIKALKESREKVFSIGGWIIPGHGKMFKVTN